MSGVAAAVGGSAVLGAVMSSNAAGKQNDAANQSAAIQRDQLAYQKEINAPYQAAGTKALGQMEDPRFQKNFSMSDFTTSPGYQFSMEQGNNALKAAQAASGNAVSGAGMAALSKYNVGSADQEYQQAFNNYQSQLNSQYGRLSTLAAGGAGANSAIGTASNNFANQSTNTLTSNANAQGASGIAQGNAIGQGLTGIAGYMNRPSAPSSAPPASSAGGGIGDMMAGGLDGGGMSMASFGV